MNTFVDWVMKNAGFGQTIKIVALSLVALIAYAQTKLLIATFIIDAPRPESYPEIVTDMFIVMLIFTPFIVLIEELIGRMFTTFIALTVFGKHRSAVMPLVIGSSTLFALLHSLGPMSVLMALATYLPLGVALQVVYLKCGGWKGGGGILIGLLSCSAVHLVYNWVASLSMVIYAQ